MLEPMVEAIPEDVAKMKVIVVKPVQPPAFPNGDRYASGVLKKPDHPKSGAACSPCWAARSGG